MGAWAPYLFASSTGMGRVLTIDSPVLRYDDQQDRTLETVDGLPNYWYLTRPDDDQLPSVTLSRGINPLRPVGRKDDQRTPAILLRSSPHKVGSATTPWQDEFAPDFGYILYHGDNKSRGRDPSRMLGNARLIDEYQKPHTSAGVAERLKATPLLFFKGVPYNGHAKGHITFQGFGIVERVELITQYDEENKAQFSNYAYNCMIMSLAREHEGFDWDWINKRRDAAVSLERTHELAPWAWREWVKGGAGAYERVRRRVSRRSLVPKVDQRPHPGSQDDKTLRTIYDFYEGKKHNFEALAAEVTGAILQRSGGRYSFGWITPQSGEGGIDYVGRLEVGSGFSRIQIVVLGQAKCVIPDTATNGKDIARTVARLRRGWIGAFVTTSYFSEPVQLEIIEDSYPLLLVHGARLAQEVTKLARASGQSIAEYLTVVDQRYTASIDRRRPEEVLHELAGLPIALPAHNGSGPSSLSSA
jgi:hypothetical protein